MGPILVASSPQACGMWVRTTSSDRILGDAVNNSYIRKPVPVPLHRVVALRYAWLRAPPRWSRTEQNLPIRPSRFGCLTTMPHMRVGKGAKRRAHASVCQWEERSEETTPERQAPCLLPWIASLSLAMTLRVALPYIFGTSSRTQNPSRSEEHTFELQSHSFISYAVF